MIADALSSMPVVAILRGVEPGEVREIGGALYSAGIRCIEVPLNSPSAFDSIQILAQSMPEDCLVGAGTVVLAEDIEKVHAAGGQLIVTPNTSPQLIELAIDRNMEIVPGVSTPTEAFSAVQSGAHYLKLFPASTFGPNHLRAMQAVLPKEVRFLAVGGIGPADFSA